METRKLQRTGGSTFSLSLPKRWVTGHGLKAKDTVFVQVAADGDLIVRARPGEAAPPRLKTITTSGEPRDHLLRKLIGAYIAGFTLIEVRFKQGDGPSVRRVVRDFSRMVIGPEILEESRTSIVLQDLSSPGELSAEKCVRRMYLSVRSMHEDSLEVLRRRDATLAKDIAQRGEDIDRLHWMVEKQSGLAHLAGPAGAAEWRGTGIHTFRLVAKLLERIGDHTERIAAAALGMHDDLEPRLLRELNAASTDALTILDRAFKALMARDVEVANEAVDLTEGLEKQADALSRRVAIHKGEDLLALGAIVDSIRRTGGYSADIAEIAINHVASLDLRPAAEDISPQQVSPAVFPWDYGNG